MGPPMDAMKDFEQGRSVEGDGAVSLPDFAAQPEAASHPSEPSELDRDERRMQVRAYNVWSALLAGRDFPSVKDMSPENDTDFGPYSVLLDFTEGMENPGIAFLGEKLAEQCGIECAISLLEQVPPRSLLTRLTDHYLQIFANRAPIGFEAEFVNQRGETILYRGILLPFSRDNDTIDFIYGVINWKVAGVAAEQDIVAPPRMALRLDLPHADDEEDEEDVDSVGVLQPLFAKRPVMPGVDPDTDDALVPPNEEEMELADWLAEARECADAARSGEDRSRKALYHAISRAYDFSLAAIEAPEDYAELLGDAGLKMQDRAPMTPLVKLVFGADYDKTRLTEYATALSHAHRLELERGALAQFLAGADGGLKGVVATERAMRREESGKRVEQREAPRPALARKLRGLPPQAFEALPAQGDEFSLVLTRRLPDGEVVMLGELPRDVALLERAARKLVG